MGLVQLYITSITPTRYVINNYGPCKVKFLHVQAKANTHPYVLRFNEIRFPNNTQNGFLFMSDQTMDTTAYLAGDAPEIVADLNGYLTISLDRLNGTIVANDLNYMVVTLDIEPLSSSKKPVEYLPTAF